LFFSLFALFGASEALAPRRPRSIARWYRWLNNFLIVALDSLVLRLFFPVAAVGFALYVEDNGWGLFNILHLTRAAAILLSIVLLDLTIYAQHVGFHKISFFWSFHRMHHADLDLDVTSGFRFHPGEIIFSMAIKFAAIAVLGAPPVAILLFELILASSSLFNHSNIRFSLRTDAFLRWFVVTPDMHRVHHSAVRKETDSNFSFSVPWWDYLFGTYCAQPAAGHDAMRIGLENFRSESDLRFDRMLVQPFIDPGTVGSKRSD
jgi:sterol desaturase/sphingolipid hydroxylase (fatty acid hydroxylase superfamily)